MLVQQRRNLIVERLQTHGGTAPTVAELSEVFDVSTIRRDLDWLDGRGFLRRVRGGAVPLIAEHDRPFDERDDTFLEEKLLIGQAAAALVRDGEQIILDCGTTTMHLARGLGAKQDATAVTNALPVAEELSHCRSVSTILLGGILKQRELCTVGPPVTAELSQLSVDKAFISAEGFSVDMGAADPDLREAEVKRAMMRAATEPYLVVDSSKWGARALVQIAPLDAFSAVITDDRMPPEAVEAIEALGVRVLTPAGGVARRT